MEVTDRVLSNRLLPSTGVIAAALVSIYGCTMGDPASPHEQVLDGTEWTLTAIETADATIDATVLENPAWVGFDMNAPEEDYQVYGFNGCNQFGGTYRQVGSQLTVSVLWNTDAPCPDSIEPVAVTFMMGLDNALQFSVSGGVLRIQCSGDTALNLYVRIDP
jgi:heat shock protein HslJ